MRLVEFLIFCYKAAHVLQIRIQFFFYIINLIQKLVHTFQRVIIYFHRDQDIVCGSQGVDHRHIDIRSIIDHAEIVIIGYLLQRLSQPVLLWAYTVHGHFHVCSQETEVCCDDIQMQIVSLVDQLFHIRMPVYHDPVDSFPILGTAVHST